MQEKHFVYFTFLDPVMQEYYAQKYHFHKLAKGNEFLPASHMSRSQAKKKKKPFTFMTCKVDLPLNAVCR